MKKCIICNQPVTNPSSYLETYTDTNGNKQEKTLHFCKKHGQGYNKGFGTSRWDGAKLSNLPPKNNYPVQVVQV